MLWLPRVASFVVLGAACITTGPLPQTSAPATSATSIATPSATGSPSALATTALGPRLSWSQPIALQGGDSILDIVQWREVYVAAGQSTEAGRYTPATFVSQDGLHWRRTAIFDASPRLVATNTRLLAIVSQIPTPLGTQAWATIDGSAWQRVSELALADASLTRVAARGSVLVAAGTARDGVDHLWRSVDGRSWTAVQTPSANAVIRDVVAVGDGFLLIGRDGAPDIGSGVGVAGTGLPAAWWSGDAGTWTGARVEGTRAAGAQLAAVFQVTGGYLAVGSDDAVSPRGPQLWTSVDARDWARVGVPSHWGLAKSDGHQLFVFGYADAQAGTLGTWVTRDGRGWTQLGFAGDVADVPAFIQSVNDNSRVDAIFAWPDRMLVIGQRKGEMTVWSTSAS